MFFSFQNIDNYIYDYLTECFFLVNIKYVVIKFAIGTFSSCKCNSIVPLYISSLYNYYYYLGELFFIAMETLLLLKIFSTDDIRNIFS